MPLGTAAAGCCTGGLFNAHNLKPQLPQLSVAYHKEYEYQNTLGGGCYGRGSQQLFVCLKKGRGSQQLFVCLKKGRGFPEIVCLF